MQIYLHIIKQSRKSRYRDLFTCSDLSFLPLNQMLISIYLCRFVSTLYHLRVSWGLRGLYDVTHW